MFAFSLFLIVSTDLILYTNLVFPKLKMKVFVIPLYDLTFNLIVF
jgi:hypothetical protein